MEKSPPATAMYVDMSIVEMRQTRVHVHSTRSTYPVVCFTVAWAVSLHTGTREHEGRLAPFWPFLEIVWRLTALAYAATLT